MVPKGLRWSTRSPTSARGRLSLHHRLSGGDLPRPRSASAGDPPTMRVSGRSASRSRSTKGPIPTKLAHRTACGSASVVSRPRRSRCTGSSGRPLKRSWSASVATVRRALPGHGGRAGRVRRGRGGPPVPERELPRLPAPLGVLRLPGEVPLRRPLGHRHVSSSKGRRSVRRSTCASRSRPPDKLRPTPRELPALRRRRSSTSSRATASRFWCRSSRPDTASSATTPTPTPTR